MAGRLLYRKFLNWAGRDYEVSLSDEDKAPSVKSQRSNAGLLVVPDSQRSVATRYEMTSDDERKSDRSSKKSFKLDKSRKDFGRKNVKLLPLKASVSEQIDSDCHCCSIDDPTCTECGQTDDDEVICIKAMKRPSHDSCGGECWDEFINSFDCCKEDIKKKKSMLELNKKSKTILSSGSSSEKLTVSDRKSVIKSSESVPLKSEISRETSIIRKFSNKAVQCSDVPASSTKTSTVRQKNISAELESPLPSVSSRTPFHSSTAYAYSGESSIDTTVIGNDATTVIHSEREETQDTLTPSLSPRSILTSKYNQSIRSYPTTPISKEKIIQPRTIKTVSTPRTVSELYSKSARPKSRFAEICSGYCQNFGLFVLLFLNLIFAISAALMAGYLVWVYLQTLWLLEDVDLLFRDWERANVE